jgi:hypothetical protein
VGGSISGRLSWAVSLTLELVRGGSVCATVRLWSRWVVARWQLLIDSRGVFEFKFDCLN